MDFKDYSIDKFLYELKTDLPSPGGGSTAALVSGLAGALNSMVYSFTVDKKAFEKLDNNNKEKMISLKEKCEEFIRKSIYYMEADRNTFTELMDTFKLPKNTNEEKKYRSQTIKEKTIAAMESPLNLAKDSLEFYDNIDFAIEFGNKNLTSDAIVAAILLHSAIESAIVNVFVNFKSLGNKEGYENIPDECKKIIELSLVRKTEIVKSFGI
ncbi:cyclodeaminase/cyclohydrolase family protein [uncultured Clostridium sp.]|uniref:cyclodeaminase/cyclohydrolase family protein n=1 Tax=uncultured Clostridium sp. TaxID=59620 RepID=UPI0025D835C1|nr:cyclodeaminase/cyclohydrolase family protein [uncultured Clostridium sp.]MDU4882884.1 cyclodeaminase/cyclohydrolase family protein [Clostridium celatum]MDU7075754.1 cyclodeaminase/cyclohydrolase family protein [Clostridium celatum]